MFEFGGRFVYRKVRMTIDLICKFECRVCKFKTIPLHQVATVLLVLLDERHLVVEENDCVGVCFVSVGFLLPFRHHRLVKKMAFIHLQNILMEFVRIWDENVVS